MTLHQKINQQIWDASGRLYPGMMPSLILVHPDTFDELTEVPEQAKYRGTVKGNTYRGIPVYRSEDMKPGEFIVR